ncbi:MAG: twin-arginine translocation signal domain-containing protein [Candidatus Marinimicrobia bacterium]|nr:twin-arginine translocation signal domain-containing protein [Candidatus Neomarinimicrobiota bacterium]
MKKKRLSRRDFLKKSSLAMTGVMGSSFIVPSSVFAQGGNIPPSERITMGAIGTGGMGRGDLRGFLSKPEVQVLAVCDVDRNHRERAMDLVNQRYGNDDCDDYNDFREVLARDDIDTITTATPDQWHALVTVAAARAGKDMYAQKPLAYSIAEGRAIVDAVKRYNVVFQTGSQQRSGRDFRFASELVRNGRIGEVKHVTVGLPEANSINNNYTGEEMPVPDGFDYDMWLGPAPERPYNPGRCHWNFRWVRDYGGGQITDWIGHHGDIAQWAMGTQYSAPVEISGEGVFPDHPLYDTVEHFKFECIYEEGFTMTVVGAERYPREANGIQLSGVGENGGRGVFFQGSEGWVHVNRSGMNTYPESLMDEVILPEETHLYESNDHRQNFVDCVKTRQECVAPVEPAHYSVMIGHLGLAAIRLGRTLRFDPETETFPGDPEANNMLSRPMRSPWKI